MEHHQHHKDFTGVFLAGVQKFGLSFSKEILEKFVGYYEEFCRWDRSINLTGLRSDEERIVLLFVDSLAGTLVLSDLPDGFIVDIGTGGGFPGIPLKLTMPGLQVGLMEPRANKTAFLLNVIGKLELSEIFVMQSRLEHFRSWQSEDEKCDVALCKGVNVEHILPAIHNILKKNGKLVVFRSKNIDNQHFRHMKVIEEISYELPFGYGARVLSVLQPDSSIHE